MDATAISCLEDNVSQCSTPSSAMFPEPPSVGILFRAEHSTAPCSHHFGQPFLLSKWTDPFLRCDPVFFSAQNMYPDTHRRVEAQDIADCVACFP